MNRLHDREGVALITALAMLLLFSLLGTAYVGYMSIEQEEAIYQVREVRSRNLAEAGVQAAIGEIEGAIASDQAPSPEYTFTFPLFVREAGDLARYPQDISVTVTDESGRININHAPREVLEALGLERSTVRNMKSRLPRGEGGNGEERRWLASVNELRTRGFVEPQTFRELDKDILTVYTVEESENPTGFINVNSAPPKVLAAIFNVGPEEAGALADKRPFTSWQDVVEKVGRDPMSFNVSPPPGEPRAMPSALALTSRVFRIVSEARVTSSGMRHRGVRSMVEAVVVFKEAGGYEIRYWSKMPSELLDAAFDAGLSAEEEEAASAAANAPNTEGSAPENADGENQQPPGGDVVPEELE